MDYYATLGVSKNASQDEIKKAFRKLASQHHPDKGGDTRKFQEIQAAYDTLSDPDKRAAYDNPQPQFQQFGGMPPGFEDIFANFGGNPFGHMFGQRRGPQRNKNLNIQTKISLEEAFAGKDLVASLKLPSGREQVIEVRIPAGIQDGTVLRLANMGDDSIPNAPRGDIHMTVHIFDHTVWRRQGDDLIKNVNITCIDAMLGKIIHVDTIDGKTLELKIHPGTQPGQILSAAGYGMPNMNDNRFKGRMLIQVSISIPTDLNERQKDLLKQFYN